MNWNKEDIELVEKFIQIRNKGYYADGTQLTEVYNRVLDKRVNPTNCGSCIRQRINELEEALNRFKRLSEKPSEPSKEIEVEDKTYEDDQIMAIKYDDNGNIVWSYRYGKNGKDAKRI